MDTVLVIEDSRAMQRTLQRLFEADSLQVQIASDGIAGLESFRNETPSVVVLDLKLPRLSGKELCRVFKAHMPSVPIVVLSADAEVLLQGLALSIKELSRGERLPTSIFLCGGGSLLPELTLEMVKNNWAAGLPFPREPRIRHLVPPDVRNLTDSTGQLSSPQDIAPMGLANHALRTEAEERDTVNTVMRRVLGGIKV